jgi:hypothetical protein
MANSKDGPRISRPRRFSEMTLREQINFACSGDPDDDDGTQLLTEDDDENDLVVTSSVTRS